MVISDYDEAVGGVRAIAYLVPHEEKWRDAEAHALRRQRPSHRGADRARFLPEASASDAGSPRINARAARLVTAVRGAGRRRG
jgi:hypothetical protein